MNRAVQGIYIFFEWVMKLAFLNFLWLVFSIGGLLVFGFFPATAALSAIVGKMMDGDEPDSLYKQFYQKFKEEYVQSQLTGWIYTGLCAAVFSILYYILTGTGLVSASLFWPAAAGLYMAGAIYLFALFRLIKTGSPHYSYYAFFLSLRAPLHTLGFLTSLILVFWLMLYKPVSLLFFSGSVSALCASYWVKEALLKTRAAYKE
ncbi:DUF624 domain-containing protein [Metabacillus sp. GX 13764]|uniref:YesL family protein n=1 Tax=Metabacillus kandeliae TaxID=2900151 RepID=UPI001E367ABF|nr:DUF624 domain-containing protein [Metabacillus kandeliae]MCD7033685.1 DUF624 domain-containing protein [Metabacillus kandeliae]